MKEHDGPKTLAFLLHTSSDHSMIPDSHLFQERVMFSLEIPLSLSLSMDTRKPLERSWKTSLDQIPVTWLKLHVEFKPAQLTQDQAEVEN